MHPTDLKANNFKGQYLTCLPILLHAEQKIITVYMSASVIEDLQDSLPNL